MAGHSKWANIKHKKERRMRPGKVFSKIAKEIMVAASGAVVIRMIIFNYAH